VHSLDVAALIAALLSHGGYVGVLVVVLPWLTYKVYHRGGWLSKAQALLTWLKKTVERVLTLGERIADALEGKRDNDGGSSPPTTESQPDEPTPSRPSRPRTRRRGPGVSSRSSRRHGWERWHGRLRWEWRRVYRRRHRLNRKPVCGINV